MAESATELGAGGWLTAAAALPPLPAANTATSASGSPTTPAASMLAVFFTMPMARSYAERFARARRSREAGAGLRSPDAESRATDRRQADRAARS